MGPSVSTCVSAESVRVSVRLRLAACHDSLQEVSAGGRSSSRRSGRRSSRSSPAQCRKEAESLNSSLYFLLLLHGHNLHAGPAHPLSALWRPLVAEEPACVLLRASA